MIVFMVVDEKGVRGAYATREEAENNKKENQKVIEWDWKV